MSNKKQTVKAFYIPEAQSGTKSFEDTNSYFANDLFKKT
jgi:hypothetical protein